MAESSLRAARVARKGGLENALFVVAAAERPPAELAAIAAEVTIQLPWGSLLRGALALADASDAAAGIASLVAPGGAVRVLASIDPRDQLDLMPLTSDEEAALADRWAAHGLELTAFRPATDAEVAGAGSTWARRLAVGRDRRAWLVVLRRPPNSGAISRLD
ncbi:MAG TPA: hypothetical protein VGQ58_04005 [Candidatus Limnocylindrales bacterium]|jgi:16S rRNA (adenine(1408)-N(1))-methyltransferase|nr:hypothetical protein [Candidatus Limnocylindrales bacterium]